LTVRLRLIDQSLRFRGVNGPAQTAIDVVDAHGSVVRAAYTAEDGAVSSGHGCVDVIHILPRGIENSVDERVLSLRLLTEAKTSKPEDGAQKHRETR